MLFTFYISVMLLFYAYFGYPATLFFISILKRHRKVMVSDLEMELPLVSIILPVYNEQNVIQDKLVNLKNLIYPRDKVEIVIVSDGSDDDTCDIVRAAGISNLKLIEIPQRKGKANALNEGMKNAAHSLIVFTDASIMIEPEALKNIVRKFDNPEVGCISGEDHIQGSETEGLYGKYELLIRNLESKAFSIIGASGCFYAQRKNLVPIFQEGMPPDFLSVLNTAKNGYISMTDRDAVGFMKSTKNSTQEFTRKVRTILRGMYTLFYYRDLFNFKKYGFFSFELFCHKILRWCVPFLLIFIFLANIFLIFDNHVFYTFTLITQIIFYCLALLPLLQSDLNKYIFARVPFYFLYTNVAILAAFVQLLQGKRQELWNPTQR